MELLADLPSGCCSWPIREDADGHWLCAEPVARSGLNYCAKHMRRAHPRENPQLTAQRLDMIRAAVARRRVAMDTSNITLVSQASADPQRVPPRPPLVCSQPDPPALGSDDNEPATYSEGVGVMPTPTLRPIEAICLNGAEPEAVATGEPIFEHANPADLLVEAAYQRELSPKSVALIRKIALGWDWRKFRPPVVVFTDAGVLIVDGQHTTIAAASRGLASIPIQIVEAPEVKERAEAFIGLNRDRLQATPVQLHHAAVAAGDETALTIEQVCQRAGLTIVRSAWGSYKWKPGETMAVNAIRDLIERRGAMKARMILEALAGAGCAPVAAHEIKAAEHLFTNEDFAAELDPLAEGGAAELASVVRALGDTADKDAKMFAATHCVPYWKGLAATWFKKCRKRRKAA